MPIPELNGVPILVTGGAGFIGSHLVDALLERGAKVRVLDNFLTGKRENLAHCSNQIDLVEGDIRDLETCGKACHGITYLFHQAALGSVPRSMKDPAATIAVNVGGTANVFSAARDAGVQRVVYASSSSVYGDSPKLPKREGEEGRPLSPYALSKVMNEQLADVFGRCFGMEMIGLRYFNVYGPRQDPRGPYGAVIPRFLAAARDGRPLELHGDGNQSRDFTYVVDIVTANLLASGAPLASTGRAYNAGAGCVTSLNDVVREIRQIFGSAVSVGRVEPRPGDIRHSQSDSGAAFRELGYVARTTFQDGLRLAVAGM